MPIEIVFGMLGFNMLNPKMKNHPPFVLPRLSNMQRSQHTKLLSNQIKQTTLDASTLAVRKDIQRSRLFQASAFLDHISLDYSSTTLYYKVLLCTTKFYSSTTLYKVPLQYYKVLAQYYSVLQSTTPVLLCTTKYYSSTNLYYKVLLQYYSVQSTTPVLLCTTTKFHSSTTKY